MRADGSDARVLAEIAATGEITFDVAWESDGEHLLFTEWSPCSDVVRRTDLSGSVNEVLVDAEGIRADARSNPRDRDDLILTHQECGEGGTLYRQHLRAGTVGPVPGIVGAEARQAEWMPNGREIVFAAGTRVLRHDVESGESAVVWERGESGITLEWVVPSGDGTELTGVAIQEGAPIGAGLVDLRTGRLEVIPLPIPASSPIERMHAQVLDCDGDGLGNGIDPSPGC